MYGLSGIEQILALVVLFGLALMLVSIQLRRRKRQHRFNRAEMPTCEVCNKRPAVGVACVPGVAYSAAYCRECAIAGANPVDILIANTVCCGGLDKCNDAWVSMVDTTLKYLHKTRGWFDEQVAQGIGDLKAWEDSQAEGA